MRHLRNLNTSSIETPARSKLFHRRTSLNLTILNAPPPTAIDNCDWQARLYRAHDWLGLAPSPAPRPDVSDARVQLRSRGIISEDFETDLQKDDVEDNGADDDPVACRRPH